MRRLVLALVVSSALVAAPSVASTPAWAQVPRGELARALVSPKVDGRRTGAMVFDLASGRLVFEKNASLSLSPASAEKLPVAFAALRLLGPGYQFRTEVIAEGELTGSTLRGNLFLVGYGDPTLRRKDLESLPHKSGGRGSGG